MPIDTSNLKEKARLAAERRNYEFAIDAYMQVLELDPDDNAPRKALRAVEVRNAKETGTSRTGAILKNLPTYIKLCLPSKNHEQVMLDCEKYLKSDPSHPRIIRKLAAAAIAAGYNRTAAGELEGLRQQHPGDVQGLRMLEETYKAMDEIAKALEVNNMILKVKPGDREATQALRDLSAANMSLKFEEAALSGERGSAARKIMKSDSEAKRLSRELRTEDDVLDEIEDTQKDIAEKGEEPRLYVKLGGLYMRIKLLDEAEDAFTTAHELSPTEYTIVMKQQDVQIARMRAQAAKLGQVWKANPKNAQAKETYREAYHQLRTFRLECFEEREKQFPTDSSIAFELGTIYFEMQNLDEAIKRYQKTAHDPKFRVKSYLNLGIAFQKKKQYPLAVKSYTEADDTLEIWNEDKMAVLYERGKCYAEMGQKEEARADLTAIYERDISFKDVATLLEKL